MSGRAWRRLGRLAGLGLALLALGGCAALPEDTSAAEGLLGGAGAGEYGSAVELLALLPLVSLAPAILTLMTGFTRIVVVLGFVRNAVGTAQTPPTQVIVGLSLILTFFVMAPVWQEVQADALGPYTAGEITRQEALQRAEAPVRDFMFRQTREKDLSLFVMLAQMERPDGPEEIPTHVLVPAYVISELKTAFQMGFMIFIPFLVIDLVVSSTLMSMGMMMLPPSMISLPFKILLFVLVDGWHLIVRSLVESFA